jgi:hypothetical protein
MNPIPRLVPTAEELLVDVDPHSPLGILMGQSPYVEDLTGGLVASTVFCAGSHNLFEGHWFDYQFSFVSKLTNFSVPVLTLHVGPSMNYPVRISVSGNDHGDYIFSTESDFLEGVKAIFLSPKSIDILRKLKSHT